ncbi:MAG: hypothetical protein ACLGJC_04455 [Alphaproteobacteria bacterium]
MVMMKGKDYNAADLGTNFGHKKKTQAGADGVTRDQWENMWVDGIAEISDRVNAVTSLQQQATAAATTSAADRQAVAADRQAVATDRASTQALVGQAQAARDGAAADRVLAQSYIGTASNAIVPAINYRLASAWDATGQPTAYALAGVVAVHRYDTRKDWDRGAWRRGKLARASTWYHEPLNTATRGGKREFPVVALIAITQTMAVIYDAHDLDASGSPRMWMVFANGNGALAFAHPVWTYAGVAACGGQLCFPNNGSGGIGLFILDFLKDASYRLHGSGKVWRCNLANRNTGVSSESVVTTSTTLPNGVVHSIDMRLLPGAPVDPVSRLPIPTIAVATAGGVSVVHPTGLVASITRSGGFSRVMFMDDQRLLVQFAGTNSYSVGAIPYATVAVGSWGPGYYVDGSTTAIRHIGGVVYGMLAAAPGAIGHDNGLTLIAEDKSNFANSLVSHVTRTYATGWMPGDTRLAAICEGAGANGASGGELVSNGDFTNGTAGWVSMPGAEAGTLSVVSGALRVVPAGAWGAGYQQIATVVGQSYTVSFDVVALAGAIATIRVRDTGGDVSMNGPGGADSATLGRRTLTFVARQTSTNICMFANSGSADFDNTSCRRTGTFSDALVGSGELVTNGDGTTATGWTAANSGALSVSGGYLRVTNGAAAFGQARQALSTVPGETYAISFTFSLGTTGTVGALLGTSAGIADLGLIVSSGASGAVLGQFRATSTTTYLSFQADNTSGHYFDVKAISVKQAVPDRGYKGKGLIVIGALNRAPVAANGDLYEVSGFSASNFMEQPYNADLDVGTGDLCFILRAGSTLAGGYFLNRAGGGGANIFIAANNANVSFQVSDGTNQAGVISNGVFTAGATRKTWAFVVRRATQRLEIWCDGALDNSVSCASVGSLTNATARLRVGEAVTPSAGTAASGLAVSMLRFCAYAPTPNQLAKIATDEGAAALGKMMLAGASNSVQALAVDEDAGLLLVGTDGVDKFAGLRNVGRVSAYSQTTGAEKVSNPGGPFTATTGWVFSNATSSVVNGEIRLTQVSTSNWGEGRVDIPVTAGKPIVVTCRLHVGTAANADVAIFDGATGLGVLATNSTTLVEKSMLITPSGSTLTLIMRNQSLVAGTTSFFALVSVRDVGAISASSIASVSAGGGALLIGTASEAGIVTEVQPIKDELRQSLPPPANDIIMEGVTVDATPADLGKVFVMEGESVQIEMEVQATEYGQTPSEGASYTVRARVRRNLGGNVQLIGSAYHVTVDETTSTMDATVMVDTSAQAFSVNVTGKAGVRLIWRARLRLNWISEVRNAA